MGGRPTATVNPDVLVLPAFRARDLAMADPPDELRRWLEAYDLSSRPVEGLPAPVYAGEGIAVTPTGVGKPAATATVTAVLSSPAVDLGGTRVVSVGVAGVAPRVGPLGSVVLAEAVVDWDRKYRWDHSDDGDSLAPLDFRTRDPVFHLDDGLLDCVERAARDASLRAVEDDRVDGDPGVRRGVSVCGDEFWYGAETAAQVDRLIAAYDLAGHACTQMEDYGTALALSRFDRLDDYVAVRAAANYDRPPASESSAEIADGVGEFALHAAAENAFRVGRRAVAALR